MGRPDLTLTGNELEITIDKGNKQWVAEITGTDEQYDLDREFIGPYGQGTETVAVDDGTVVEKCWYSHGGREKGREYYVVAGGQLCEIDEATVERALDATVVAIDADSGRSHECDECGNEFDSAHGLSIHEGMVHDEDGDEADDVTAAETDGGQPVVADGGHDPVQDDRISREEFAELAAEYRDELLKSLGVIAVQRSPKFSAPGTKIRRLPVEAAAGHDDVGAGVGTQRILTDVTDYDGDLNVPAADDVRFMTIRETTGHAAIYSSATLGLGWETVPTPREVQLAEYLEALDDSDLYPQDYYSVGPEHVGDMLIETLFPRQTGSRCDETGLWLPVDETAVGNVEAVKHCVTMIDQIEDGQSSTLQRIHGTDDFGEETEVFSRWGTDNLVVESYNGPDHSSFAPDRRDRVFLYDRSSGAWEQCDDENTTVDGWGYFSTEYVVDEAADEAVTVSTELYTIPEFATPEAVLDLPRKTPSDPHADGGESDE